MWLLDVNLPNRLRALLHEFGIESDTTFFRGWRNLANGALAKEAVKAGFQAILTRDKLFGDSAGKALKTYPQLSVVVLLIPQSKSDIYLAKFKEHWNKSPIQLLPGQVIEWPE